MFFRTKDRSNDRLLMYSHAACSLSRAYSDNSARINTVCLFYQPLSFLLTRVQSVERNAYVALGIRMVPGTSSAQDA